jgi:hypothetical protein
MTIVRTFLLVLCLSTVSLAQGPPVTPLTLPAGSPAGEITGNIAEGQKMSLDWAAQSSVAAFPGTRFEMFDGNHVLYRVNLPAASEITITLTPENGKLINLYALRQGVNETASPPNISTAISAEASYPRYANLGAGKTVSNPDNGVRKVQLMSIDRPYSILIGVAGAQGLTEGVYKLHVQIDGR